MFRIYQINMQFPQGNCKGTLETDRVFRGSLKKIIELESDCPIIGEIWNIGSKLD